MLGEQTNKHLSTFYPQSDMDTYPIKGIQDSPMKAVTATPGSSEGKVGLTHRTKVSIKGKSHVSLRFHMNKHWDARMLSFSHFSQQIWLASSTAICIIKWVKWEGVDTGRERGLKGHFMMYGSMRNSASILHFFFFFFLEQEALKLRYLNPNSD